MKPNRDYPRDDVVMSGTDADDSSDPLSLEPTDPEVDAARRRRRESESFSSNTDAPDTPPPRIQFSLQQLMLATLVIAVGLAVLQLMLPQLVVFLLGLVAFAFLIAVSAWQPANPTVYVVTWSLLILYIIAAIAVLLTF